jgi:poly(A) polymerase
MEGFLGVTPPISTTGPTERDLEVTKHLIETLRSMDQYESDGEAQKR